MEIKIYTLPTCPNCKMLKKKMDIKNIKYTECQDTGSMKDKGIFNTPYLEVDGVLMDLSKANDWVNSQEDIK